MPTYSYACKDCGYRFDQRQSFSDDALTICPQCAGHLRKLFHSVGIVFKGSGFYHNDSRAEARHSSLAPAPSGEKSADHVEASSSSASSGDATTAGGGSSESASGGQAASTGAKVPATVA